jgi:two-component system, OmpR family, sensor kinase
MLLGLFSVGTLDYIDGISAEIRDRWLQSTRLLGDLNNSTSDFRAAEGSVLLASGAEEIAAGETDIRDLDLLITRARHSYQHIRHDRTERELYRHFETNWDRYRKIADQVISLLRADRRDDAVALYRTESRTSYDAASDALDRLTDWSVAEAGEARHRAAEAYQKARFLILASIVFAGLMVGAAVRFISRSLFGPLLDLAGRMNRLAANQTDVEINDTERSDEIGQMARAVVVFQDNAKELAISQRALAEQASMLEEKLEQEQRLTLMQRNFVSMASHEFRTPLSIIDGHAQRLIALKDRLNAGELAERTGKIRAAVKRLTLVMGNLLDSSRLLDGNARISLHYEEFDISALLREVCLLHREIAPRAQLREAFPYQPLRVTADRNLLLQAFSNLISNAIKYSPDGGLVEIAAASDGREVSVTIRDHGIGIPDEEKSHLFERYFRGSNVSGTVGTGIGLYLVALVVELHNGSVSVDSRLDTGSEFTIRFPVGAEMTIPVAARAVEPAFSVRRQP